MLKLSNPQHFCFCARSLADALTPAEQELYDNPEMAALRLFHEGEFLPVGRMYGANGQVVTNPLHAFACIAFAEHWTIVSCRPGDIEPVRESRPWLRNSPLE